ncbi:hypothetical protein D3C72_1269830 [compost metagenome]
MPVREAAISNSRLDPSTTGHSAGIHGAGVARRIMALPRKPDSGGRPTAASTPTRYSTPASREATGAAPSRAGSGSSASASRNRPAVHSVVLGR